MSKQAMRAALDALKSARGALTEAAGFGPLDVRLQVGRSLRDADSAISALSAAVEEEGWMSIETAPKDRDVWLFVPKEEPSQVVGYWIEEDGGFWQYRERLVADVAGMIDSPSHWMPLPAAPQKGSA